MISVEQCRQALGPAVELSDDELERLRNRLYALADIAVTSFLNRRQQGETANLQHQNADSKAGEPPALGE